MRGWLRTGCSQLHLMARSKDPGPDLEELVGPATSWEGWGCLCQAGSFRQRWKARTSSLKRIADRREISYINAAYFVLPCATPAGLLWLFQLLQDCKWDVCRKHPKNSQAMILSWEMSAGDCTVFAMFLCPVFISTTGLGMPFCFFNFFCIGSQKLWQ